MSLVQRKNSSFIDGQRAILLMKHWQFLFLHMSGTLPYAHTLQPVQCSCCLDLWHCPVFCCLMMAWRILGLTEAGYPLRPLVLSRQPKPCLRSLLFPANTKPEQKTNTGSSVVSPSGQCPILWFLLIRLVKIPPPSIRTRELIEVLGLSHCHECSLFFARCVWSETMMIGLFTLY